MKKSFYQAFEDQHRGSRELIKNRLKVYLPFVTQLQALYPKGKALDLGCGRGEWLELLRETGIAAQGVDLDEGMLGYCVEQGLSITQGEVLAFVKALPDNSQMLVSGFHIAEHLAFGDLQTLIQEALRILKPAGLLILETPNPENLVVGTANFYIDPTHQRPLPQPLLAFLPEYYGFCRTKVLRLQESPALASNPAPTLFEVLSGASPDYAIIGQKKASKKQLAAFDDLFSKEYGISIETLAARYEMNVQQNYRLALEVAQQAVQHAENRTQALEAQLAAQQAESQRLAIEAVKQQAENQRLTAELTQRQAENQRLETETAQQQAENQSLTAIVAAHQTHQQQLAAQLAEATLSLQRYTSSYSWKLTLPLRLATRPLRVLLKNSRLLRIKDAVIPPPSSQPPSIQLPTLAPGQPTPPPYTLTPAARAIYDTLKQAIAAQETT